MNHDYTVYYEIVAWDSFLEEISLKKNTFKICTHKYWKFLHIVCENGVKLANQLYSKCQKV